MNEAEATPGQTEAPSGIGGWLLLVLLGLIVSPLRTGFFLFETYWPLYRDGAWHELLDPRSEFHDPEIALLLGFEIVGNACAIMVALATLYLFCRKSRLTPRFAIAWFGGLLAFNLADYVLVGRVPLLAAGRDSFQAVKDLALSAIRAGIWIPYFMTSKRVRATFIH